MSETGLRQSNQSVKAEPWLDKRGIWSGLAEAREPIVIRGILQSGQKEGKGHAGQTG
jgi:hypothetical protein